MSICRKNHVGEEDRREDESARDHITRDRILNEESFRPDCEVQCQHPEEEQIENPNAADRETGVDQDGDQDARQDGEEDEGVDVPGAAEKKGEGRERFHFQEREGNAEKKHVPVELPEGAAGSDPKDAGE